MSDQTSTKKTFECDVYAFSIDDPTTPFDQVVVRVVADTAEDAKEKAELEGEAVIGIRNGEHVVADNAESVA